jgi:sigma-B regulation protein RsbU (phosphoserine phosphatase)
VVKTGEPLRIPDVARDRRYFMARPQTRSELVVPLISGERAIGAFNLENDRPDAYRPSDVRMLLSFANQAAISVQRARIHRELMSRQRLQDEVEVARRIQESFLPAADPELPGYDLSGHTTPSLEVGGDSYDAFPVADGHWGIMIADVAGKGIPAALILATFRAALRSEVRNQYAIGRILENINGLLLESTRPEQFVTAVYGVLDLRARVLTYANAGHNPPAVLRASGEVAWLNDGGTILGAFAGSSFEEGRIALGVGDILLLHTDGASEAWNASGEEFGVERMIEIVRSNRDRSAAEIRLALTEAILRHCEGKAQDDVTLLVLRVI